MGMLLSLALFLTTSLPVAAAQEVSIELGPANPSPCVGEPLVLEATATNRQGDECMLWAGPLRFEFTVQDRNGDVVGRTSFHKVGMRPSLQFALAGLSSATFAVPFPLLTVAWREYSGGTMGPLGVGKYTVLWAYRPFPNAECSVEGNGKFDLVVQSRNEKRLNEAYAAVIARATAAYEGGLSGYHRTNEKEIVEYLVECSTDPVAVPYLEQLLEIESRSLRGLARTGLMRVGTEEAGEILRRYAEGDRGSDWERERIEEWMDRKRTAAPWE